MAASITNGNQCVRHKNGWCLIKHFIIEEGYYTDKSIETKCGYYVILPFGIEIREPDCPECIAILKGENNHEHSI